MAQTQVRGAQIKDDDLTASNMAAANVDGAAGTPCLRTLGTGANQAKPGNTPAGGSPTSADGSVAISGSTVAINQNWLNQFALINGYLEAYVFGTFVNVRIRTSAGNIPSAADPVYIVFRSVTSASGAFVLRTITSDLFLGIPDLSTFGIVSPNGAARLWVLAIDDNGTLRIGFVNCWEPLFGVYKLREDRLIVASSMSTPPTSARAIFCNATVTLKPFRILGYIEWKVGYSPTVLPTKVQGFRHGIQLPGDIVQKIPNYNGAIASGTLTIPFDGTTPLATEGNLFLTTAIKPTSDANVIHMMNINHVVISTASHVASTICRDGVTNALAAVVVAPADLNLYSQTKLEFMQIADANGAIITYRGRSGNNVAGTTYFNRNSVSGHFNGVLGSCLNLSEIMA